MEIKVGTHKRLTQTDSIIVGRILGEYSDTDRCARHEVLDLRSEIINTKMFESNDENNCTVVRAIKFELESLKDVQVTPKVRRYKETLQRIIKSIEE